VSDKLARTLVEVLIDNAFPARDLSRPEFVSFPDVAEMFFKNAAMIRDAAQDSGHVWSPAAVREADDIVWVFRPCRIGSTKRGWKL
jgi:hypothetical protein